jgi:cytochrome c peroxidase
MHRTSRSAAALALAALASLGCNEQSAPPRPKPAKHVAAEPAGYVVDSAKLTQYAALPAVAPSKEPVTDEKVALGRMLWHDKRLSKTGTVSCNDCHDLAKSGVDGKPFSTGAKGTPLARNTPSIYGAAAATSQFWDARAETIEDAILAMLADPEVMGAPDDARLTKTFESMPEYAAAFKKAFPDDAAAVTQKNVTRAIGAFTRRLMTPSKWDQFLGGDKKALTDDEKKGFVAFVDTGCPECHVGPLVGATMIQILGKKKPWPNQKDKGRSTVTKSFSDDMMFRVASLRNVEHTAPYFHDATGTVLEETVKTMASVQLDKVLPAEDVTHIVAWLKTLSGSPAAADTQVPPLPASTATTPKPDKK